MPTSVSVHLQLAIILIATRESAAIAFAPLAAK